MKAHLVFHQLISDVTAPKYVFLTYLSRHYATANRSSVDSTTFDIISDYRNFNQQNALPNLAHSIPLYMERNRLISDYNRYLRERILHYRFLRMDPIREKLTAPRSWIRLIDTSYICQKPQSIYSTKSNAVFNKSASFWLVCSPQKLLITLYIHTAMVWLPWTSPSFSGFLIWLW